MTGPCGGQAPEAGSVEYHLNSTVTIAWTKNQDHWDAASPGMPPPHSHTHPFPCRLLASLLILLRLSLCLSGYFSVGYATAPNQPFTELTRIADSATPSLSIYEAAINFPAPSPTGVLSIEYNSGQGFSFFACGDIVVV